MIDCGGGGLNSNLSSIPLYYWRGEYNLGDALNLELVERLKQELIEVFPYKHKETYEALQARIYKSNLLRKISELDKSLMCDISNFKEEVSKLQGKELQRIYLEFQKSLDKIQNKKPNRCSKKGEKSS